MRENADPETSPAESKPRPRVEGAAPSEIGGLTADLRAAGVEPRLLRTARGVSAGGAALAVSVQGALRLASEGGRAMRSIVALARAGVPLTLSLRNVGGGDAGTEALEGFCRRLHDALAAEGQPPDGIGLSLRSHGVPLKAYLLISTALLGRGSRYVLLDSLQMQHHDDPCVQRETEHNWSLLWRHCSARSPLLPAYAASVTTRCVLSGDEAATTILPELGMQVPAGTAWLPLVLHLPDFSDGRGRLCWNALEYALQTAVELGDRLLDCLRWPDPVLQKDAVRNRRLAIAVSGIGDLVLERGADPADLAALQWIDGAVSRLHAVLWDRSRALARRLGPLPSLLQAEPAAVWQCDRKRSDWQLRWRHALEEAGVRHRNLLVLSPYSVLPSGAPASDYVDLLPVLKHADAFNFAGPPAASFRSVSEFAGFHRRAWAVIQRRNAAAYVASGA
ncbi:MAG TPA: hypothetical protein VHG33_09070 [Woeseiaceae bacterium]|nr:hypothetical protein [Woeseiaceae bacterium]